MWLFLLASAEALSCSKYQCNSAQLTPNQCSAYVPDSDTFNLQLCQAKEICNVTNAAALVNTTCTEPSVSASVNWPGEPCRVGTDCLSGNCTKLKCVGVALQGNCLGNSDCNPGLYCSTANSVCVAQLSTGSSGCLNDFECENGAGCDLTGSTGKCVAYHSIPAGGAVAECTGTNLLCENYLCAYSSQGFTCMAKVASSSSLPVMCTTDFNCTSTVDASLGFSVNSDCSCGINPTGAAYCGLFPGDEPYSRLLAYWVKWYGSATAKLCNTERRFFSECMAAYWVFDDYVRLAYALSEVMNWAVIQKNDACIQGIYTRSYWELYAEIQENDNDDSDDDDNALVTTAAVGVVALISAS